MNLIEKWKNRETKKKLREENIRLKDKIESYAKAPCRVYTVERNVQKLSATLVAAEGMPEEIVKQELLRNLTMCLSDFVEYGHEDGGIHTASLYVATNRKAKRREGYGRDHCKEGRGGGRRPVFG